jgi:hypothetical protein
MPVVNDKITPVMDKIESAAADIFELVYKKGNLLHTVHFRAPDKETAIEKAKALCEKRQLRYIYVNPWLHDIDKMINFETDDNWPPKR